MIIKVTVSKTFHIDLTHSTPEQVGSDFACLTGTKLEQIVVLHEEPTIWQQALHAVGLLKEDKV